MSLSTFFYNQARKPSGLFGKIFMSVIFNKGNKTLNTFVYELLSVEKNDRIFEIGFGTGRLMNKIAGKIEDGCIQGTDFSEAMVSLARKRNKKHIQDGKIKLFMADFDNMPVEKELFTKICSINTLYFWKDPLQTTKKIMKMLNPGGKLILAFEDIIQLRQRKVDENILHLYTKEEVVDILVNAGFKGGVTVQSRNKNDLVFHCAVAIK